jgi:hypothetical protein
LTVKEPFTVRSSLPPMVAGVAERLLSDTLLLIVRGPPLDRIATGAVVLPSRSSVLVPSAWLWPMASVPEVMVVLPE